MMIFDRPQMNSSSTAERIFDLYAYLCRLHDQLQMAEEQHDREIRELKAKIEKLEGKNGTEA